MNAFNRAVLYITRKKKKSIIMLFILFGIATAVLSGISIKKAANVAKDDSNRDVANNFEITTDIEKNLNGTIPESLVNEISKVDGIKNSDGIIQGGALDFKDINYVEPTQNVVQYEDDYKYKNLFPVEAHTSTELDTKFKSKSFKLVEGRHIVETDQNKAIISKELAQKNNIKIGDIIRGTKNNADRNVSKTSQNEYNLEVVGFFEATDSKKAGNWMEVPENTIMTDMYTLKTLYGYSDGNTKYTSAIFNASDNVENVISNVKKVYTDWSKYKILRSEDNFLALSKSFDSLQKIINMVLVGAVVASAIILSLILAFWIQGRVHETGILLSIGVSKFKIISQYVIELLLISVLAFGASYFSSKVISQNIGNAIVNQASKQAVQEVNNELSGFSFGNDANTSLLTRTVSEIDVKVEFKELAYVYVIGSGIIIVSVLLSSAPIIRLKPKEILSKMS